MATALPECTDPDDVSITVKAFLSADLPIQLIELLEKIIIEPSPFSDNKNLQNLLLLTAIWADKGKVVGYINKLQNYDAGEIAKIATDHGLYKEALTIYKKYYQHAMTINVLVEHIISIDRGLDYAGRVNRPEGNDECCGYPGSWGGMPTRPPNFFLPASQIGRDWLRH